MYALVGYKRLAEGRDYDLQKQYGKAVKKYTEGIEIVLDELEHDKSKATEDMLCKVDRYIGRIKLLKSFMSDHEDGTPPAILLPQEPTQPPVIGDTGPPCQAEENADHGIRDRQEA
jgi:hypothetical protein